MDLYGSDKKLSELDHTDFGEFLNQSVFTAPPPSLEPYGIDVAADMEDDWFENFFDAPADPVDCILHDKMMSEALQSPQVKTEHSYSCANGVNGVNNVNVVQTIDDEDKELDLELQRTLNPMNMTPTTQALNLCTTELNRAVNSIKEEPTESEVTTVTVTRTTNPQTLLKQPTIILATQPQVQHIGQPLRTQERLVLPKVNIKVESHQQQFVSSPEHSSDYGYDNLSLPPTPPSSNNSDSDGSQSPDRSAPNSPMRSTHLSRHAYRSMSPTQPLFMSPIPTSGVLILTEEEKRTLISEGYPIPQKLPLTKQEEKNLKKIRRKIKNKISAQESRRKKKEYLETLERKVESFSSENMDLKKKVDVLENNNRSLMSQLQKLQTLAGKLTRPSNTSTQTGTCLMVFVLCFAVFLGTWSPMSLSVGYSGINAGVAPSMLTKKPVIESSLIGGGGGLPPFDAPSQAESGGKRGGRGSAMGPELQTPISDVYSTPNMRSRVLMSVTEEESAEEFGPIEPFSYKDFFVKWFSSASQKIGPEDEALIFEPPLPKVEVLDVETEINQTGEGRAYANVPQQAPPPMHPDISVTTKPQRLDNAA